MYDCFLLQSLNEMTHNLLVTWNLLEKKSLTHHVEQDRFLTCAVETIWIVVVQSCQLPLEHSSRVFFPFLWLTTLG